VAAARPHLLNAAMSLGTVAALVALMRQAFSLNLALLGGVLFVTALLRSLRRQRPDRHPVTGLCVLAFWLHLRALRTRRLPSFALAGAIFGCAIAMRFTAPAFGAAIAATELAALYVLDRRRTGRAGGRACGSTGGAGWASPSRRSRRERRSSPSRPAPSCASTAGRRR